MNIAFIGDSLTQGIPGSSYFVILYNELPQHRLLNLGKGNDTIVSLYRRVAHMRFGGTPFDVAFLWVGVNDVDIAVVSGRLTSTCPPWPNVRARPCRPSV